LAVNLETKRKGDYLNLKSLLNPDLYHGRMSKDYFEGWYFKIVDKNATQAFAFIPGISFSSDSEHDHAFIQIIDGMKKTYCYERFLPENFKAAGDIFSVDIAGNSFGHGGISFNLARKNVNVNGQLKFSNHLKWPDNFLNPGSMGFYNYILKMQCYSQVCAMDCDLNGSLEVNGNLIDFNNGKGYIEKNWGSAFPYSWVWVQGNHFQKERASLSCSLAHIPFPVTSFRGFLVGLYVGDKFYKFTSMNRSKVEVLQKGTDLRLELKNRFYSMTIDCETSNENYILLNGPRGGQMVPLVQENLQGFVHVTLRENNSGRTIFSDQSRCAGVEYGGEQIMVLDIGC